MDSGRQILTPFGKDFMEKRGFELGFEGRAAKFQQIEAGVYSGQESFPLSSH